jgi:hypothetical protein
VCCTWECSRALSTASATRCAKVFDQCQVLVPQCRLRTGTRQGQYTEHLSARPQRCYHGRVGRQPLEQRALACLEWVRSCVGSRKVGQHHGPHPPQGARAVCLRPFGCGKGPFVQTGESFLGFTEFDRDPPQPPVLQQVDRAPVGEARDEGAAEAADPGVHVQGAGQRLSRW